MMRMRVHAGAGLIGLLTIVTFWSATVSSELLGSGETVAAVKAMILSGMLLLVPAMTIVGASGRSLAVGRDDARLKAKAQRMGLIAGNGLLILVPSAFYLAGKAAAGAFDTWFYAVQALELIAGAINIALMGLNFRDGLRLTGRLGMPRRRHA